MSPGLISLWGLIRSYFHSNFASWLYHLHNSGPPCLTSLKVSAYLGWVHRMYQVCSETIRRFGRFMTCLSFETAALLMPCVRIPLCKAQDSASASPCPGPELLAGTSMSFWVPRLCRTLRWPGDSFSGLRHWHRWKWNIAMSLMKIFLMTLPSLKACLPVPQRCPLAPAPPAKCHRALYFLPFLLMLWSHHIQRKGQHPHPTLCQFLYFEFQGCSAVSEEPTCFCPNSCSAPGSGLTPLGAQALLGLPQCLGQHPPHCISP